MSSEIELLVNKDYQYGFATDIEADALPPGLTEDVVRRIGLSAGLVDVKVCAVTEVWSGLKFVRRLKDR